MAGNRNPRPNSSWATTGHVKVQRARELLDALVPEAGEYFRPGTFDLLTEEDTLSGDLLFRLKVHRPIPARIGAIAGDIVHNARTALTFLWLEVRREWPKKWKSLYGDGDFSKLPQLHELDGAVAAAEKFTKWKVGVQVLKGFDAFIGGKELFSLLIDLDNTDKHKLLLPVHNGLVFTQRRRTPGSDGVVGRRQIVQWDFSSGQDPLVSLSATDRAEFEMSPEPQEPRLTFGAPEKARGKLFLVTLMDSVQLVENIEKEFLKAGLLI
jgi:hypothetical protein